MTIPQPPVDWLRGARFTGIPEAVGGLMVLAMTLIYAPTMSGAGLGVGVVICTLCCSCGRWPILGVAAVTFAVGVGFLFGLSVSSSPAFAAQLVAVEGIASTGRVLWMVPAAAVQVVFWWWEPFNSAAPTTPLASQQPGAWTGFALSVGFVALAAALGLIRYRILDQKHRLDARHETQLAGIRRDIARDLHDSVAHDLTRIVLRAETARALPDLPRSIAHELDVIVATGHQSITDMRAMLTLLRKDLIVPDPDIGGPARDVSGQLDRARQRLREAGLEPDIAVTGELDDMSALVADVLTKCLQEAINNAIKHAAPGTTCVLRMDRNDTAVELLVLNTAKSPAASRLHGLGLVGMAERIKPVQGSIEYGARGNGLWALTITLPLRRTATDQIG